MPVLVTGRLYFHGNGCLRRRAAERRQSLAPGERAQRGVTRGSRPLKDPKPAKAGDRANLPVDFK
jgi:hypothetical protein